MNITNILLSNSYITNDEISLQLSLKETTKEEYFYYIVLNATNKIIGYISFRPTNNINNYYYGNIGYRILENYRGNHYAYQACNLLIKVLNELNVQETYFTVSPNNIASIRTIEKLNVQFIKKVQVPSWHKLYERNEKEKLILFFSCL